MKPVTLFDTIYKASYRNVTPIGWSNNEAWRAVLKTARRFVLDDAMSSFMADLATHAFLRDKLSPAAINRTVDHLRMGARLPAAAVWVEYNLHAYQTRQNALLGRTDAAPMDEIPAQEGWLLQRHPAIETAFIVNIVTHDTKVNPDGFDTWAFPTGLAWTVDSDTVLPWRKIPFDESRYKHSEVATGIPGYISDRTAYVYSPLVDTASMSRSPASRNAITKVLTEWAGCQRRIWAFLSTINDLPVLVQDVRASKGFVAKGAYRKFLDYKTVTLTVPTKLYRKTIRDALALAHRRGGAVREHWRKDWRRPLHPMCDHQFDADEKHMFCTVCDGRKIWINEHVRGDTSRGFVTRDYNVTHEEPAA